VSGTTTTPFPHIDAHQARHAEPQASVGWIAGLATELLIGHVRFENGLDSVVGRARCPRPPGLCGSNWRRSRAGRSGRLPVAISPSSPDISSKACAPIGMNDAAPRAVAIVESRDG
jgi:hypothetical protein